MTGLPLLLTKLRLLMFTAYHATLADFHAWHPSGKPALHRVHAHLCDEGLKAWDDLNDRT
jgi:hypothetical protein